MGGKTRRITGQRAVSKKRAGKPSANGAEQMAPVIEKVLILRTCDENLCGYGGFQWPESGHVEAPDWKPTPECGFGLHGLLWGEGNGQYLNWEPKAKWLVVEVDKSGIVDIDGKVKFKCGNVVHCGDRLSAVAYIQANGGAGKAVVGGTATAGDRGTATAGDSGTATAGSDGVIILSWWDNRAQRRRIVVGYVGEDGIKPKVKYKLDPETHAIVEAEPSVPSPGKAQVLPG